MSPVSTHSRPRQHRLEDTFAESSTAVRGAADPDLMLG
jgi:hypothetical protein